MLAGKERAMATTPCVCVFRFLDKLRPEDRIVMWHELATGFLDIDWRAVGIDCAYGPGGGSTNRSAPVLGRCDVIPDRSSPARMAPQRKAAPSSPHPLPCGRNARTAQRGATEGVPGKRARVLECSSPLELWPNANPANQPANEFCPGAAMGGRRMARAETRPE